MSRVNFGFTDSVKVSKINLLNRMIFAYASVNRQLAAENRRLAKEIDELEKIVSETKNDNTREKALADIDAKMVIIERNKALTKALNENRSIRLFGIHTKAVNIDGIIDDVGIADLFNDYQSFCSSEITRADFEKRISIWLETLGCVAPTKLFEKSARAICYNFGRVKTGDVAVIKGELVKGLSKLAFYEMFCRAAVTEFRKTANLFETYTSELYEGQFTYIESSVGSGYTITGVWCTPNASHAAIIAEKYAMKSDAEKVDAEKPVDEKPESEKVDTGKEERASIHEARKTEKVELAEAAEAVKRAEAEAEAVKEAEEKAVAENREKAAKVAACAFEKPFRKGYASDGRLLESEAIKRLV